MVAEFNQMVDPRDDARMVEGLRSEVEVELVG